LNGLKGNGLLPGANTAAAAVGAVIVNVEVGDLVPSVTDEGESAQVNAGCGPVTEQES